MTDEERRVLHKDLDRIIDGGDHPAIISRRDLDHLMAIAKNVQVFVESASDIAKEILAN